MSNPNTESFEDQAAIYDEHAWRLFLRTRITNISTEAEDDIIEEVSKLLAAHQATIDQREAGVKSQLTKEIRAVYHAKSRDGGPMFDFAGFLDSQVEAFEADVTALTQPEEKRS